jgi:L-fuculose-phosphate aldolase
MTHRSEASLRREICDAGRTLYDRGLIGPLDGNLSARVGERYLVCTPSGSHKGELRPDDLVKLTLDGRVVSPGATPSSELKMHLAIYRERPEIACVVHAHPPCAVGLTVAGVSLERPVVPEILFAIGAVPNVPYSSPTTDAVPDAIKGVLARCDAFMLARHGSVCLCATPRDGVIMTETIEHTAKITLAARVAGGGAPLPDGEISKLLGLAAAARGGPDPAMVEAVTRAVVSRLRG